MRLLTWNEDSRLVLTDDLQDSDVPPYAILSHTWGKPSDEVTFDDIQWGLYEHKNAYQKIKFCSKRARIDEIEYFWIDTCCINRADYTELSAAINSMFRWYRNAQKCYAYLWDVVVLEGDEEEESFRNSRWFTRGWTLQELLAPKVVEFFSSHGGILGNKESLSQSINEITGIPIAALYGAPLTGYSIAERWKWAQNRQTTRPEDQAYCLLGIFDVFMTLIYGEGANAFRRLENEVNARSAASDQGLTASTHAAEDFNARKRTSKRLLASEDQGFAKRHCNQHVIDSLAMDHDSSPAKVSGEGEGFSEENFKKLLESLLFDRIEFRVNNIKKALLSTCEWLFRHPEFQSWYGKESSSQHNGFFWIKGKPGSGKSTLMKTALEWAQQKKREARQNRPTSIVSYFFNARGSDLLEKSSLGFYRTVVYHLLSTYRSLRPLFMRRFFLKQSGPVGENWTVTELQEFLYDCTEAPEPLDLLLFVDALDEAEREDDVRRMISFLIDLSDRAIAAGGSFQLQVCLSSRHYPHISIGRGSSLVVEEQVEHSHDIRTYINKQLNCAGGSEEEVLRASLLQKSSGVFLWVVLVVEILNRLSDRGFSLSDLRARLDKTPADLSNLFRHIFQRVDEDDEAIETIETTVLLFQWVLFGVRRLGPEELYVAIQYGRFSMDQAWNPPVTISLPPPDILARYLVHHSHGLIEIAHASKGQIQSPVVQFIHETVREFLIGDHGLTSVLPSLAPNLFGISHETLRVACFRRLRTHASHNKARHHLTNDQPTEDMDWDLYYEVWEGDRFLRYAAKNLFEHAELAQTYHVPQHTFLQTQMDADGFWLDSYRNYWNAVSHYINPFPDTRLLYFIFKQQHFNLFRVLIQFCNTNVNVSCVHEMLQSTSANGHEAWVRTLLEAGVDVNVQGKPYGTALIAASANSKEAVVRVLLEAGADVNTKWGQDGTALTAAFANRNQVVVRMLLEAGADVNAKGGRYGTALHQASFKGDQEAVRMLLEAGADVNTRVELYYGTALQAASANSNKEVVCMLLEAGADVNAAGGRFGTALQVASINGDEEMVRMLLDSRADVNMNGGSCGTALIAALIDDNKEVTRMLLEAGADVNVEGGKYGTALQVASALDRREIVRMLLEAGADVNADRGEHGTALQIASVRDHREVVRMLLEAGADAHAQESSIDEYRSDEADSWSSNPKL